MTDLVYNGNVQTGVVNIPSTNGAILKSGKVTATNAGDYSATFALKSGHCWSDNTNDDFTINWSIAKAENPVSVTSIQELNLNYSANEQINLITAATNAQGSITYELLSQTKEGVSVNAFVLNGTTLTAAENTPVGTYNLLVKAIAAGNENYNSATKNIAITVTVNKSNITPTLSMNNYIYGGIISTPTVSGNIDNGTVTYYYNTTNSTKDGILWTTVTSSTYLDVGTYYMYAVVGETANCNSATTNVVEFEISKITLNAPMNLRWTLGTAKWDAVPAVNGITITYNVALLKSAHIGVISEMNGISATQCDFTSLIKTTGAGSYTFEVTAISSNSSIVSSSSAAASGKQFATKVVLNISAGIQNASIANASEYVIISGENNIPLTATTNVGYTFKGFVANNASLEIKKANQSSATVSCNIDKVIAEIEITVNCDVNKYSIVFDSNSATSGTMPPEQFTYDTSKELPTNAFQKIGHTFIGWNTKVNGSGIAYENGQTILNITTTNNDEIVLYAQWSANSYTVTYDANGGEFKSSNNYQATATVKYGEKIDLITNRRYAEKQGYIFVGWNTNKNATNAQDSLTMEDSDVTLYAIYSQDTQSPVIASNSSNKTVMIVGISGLALVIIVVVFLGCYRVRRKSLGKKSFDSIETNSFDQDKTKSLAQNVGFKQTEIKKEPTSAQPKAKHLPPKPQMPKKPNDKN